MAEDMSFEEQVRSVRWDPDPAFSASIAEYMIKAWPVMVVLQDTVGTVVTIDNARWFRLDGARVDGQGWLVVWGEFWNAGEKKLTRKTDQPLMFRDIPHRVGIDDPLETAKRIIGGAL